MTVLPQILQSSELHLLTSLLRPFQLLEVPLQVSHEDFVLFVERSLPVITELPIDFFAPLKNDINFSEFLFDSFGMKTAFGLFYEFTNVNIARLLLKICY